MPGVDSVPPPCDAQPPSGVPADARGTLRALRGALQRDWVSFGLDASLDALLESLREHLGDPQLQLVLWAESLPVQLGEGRGFRVLSEGDPLGAELKRSQALAAPPDGTVLRERRWFPLWLQDVAVGALGGDPRLPAGLLEEAAGVVRDLVAAAGRSQRRVFNDPLTGVHNRGFFDRQFANEMERSRRSGAPLTLLFLDLDRFKSINDDNGHEAGDVVLRSVASLLVGHRRRIDYVFRYGGEEFALLLPGTEATEGYRTAERLRRTVEEAVVLLPDGRELSITVSIGGAVFPDHGDQERVLLRRADMAMYQAKEAGRNRVVMWGAGSR